MFFRETGATVDTLVLLPLNTLTLFSAWTFRAETAVVIGAETLPSRPAPLKPPAKAGEAQSKAREAGDNILHMVLLLYSSNDLLGSSTMFFPTILTTVRNF